MQPCTTEPYSETIWDQVETWSRDRIAAFQLAALRRQLQHLARNSAHYRQVFAAIGFEPGDLRDLSGLQRLPITRKADYLAGLQAAPPFGTLAALAPGDALRVHFSSGTTASPTPMLWSAFDLERWAGLYARYLYAQGLRRGDTVQCLFGYAWFVGGLGITLAAQRLGALLIPGGAGDSARQIDTLFDYGARCVTGTPSFITHLTETAQQCGRDLARSRVELLCVGGEPGASVPGTRARLESAWGAKMFDCYGALECQPIAWDSAAQLGPVLAEDFHYAEVLDPQTCMPVADGARGVLVLTHLDKQACPLLRWWTGDIVVRDSRPAPDGRTHARLPGGVLGRADDMLIVRGVNLFPTAVEDVVRAFADLGSEYQIVVTRGQQDSAGATPASLRLRVERAGGAAAGQDAQLAERLCARLRDTLQVRFQIELLAPGALPRSVHKAKRVLYE